MSKVSVHIVTWNSQRFIENVMRSLDEQAFRDFSILIIDNDSTDNTVVWLKENYPQIKIVQNNKNLGFAKAHNQAISFTKSEYVLVMNVDVILNEDYLKNLVAYMDDNAEAGSLTGKIYRLIGNPAQMSEDSFTKVIDNTGLRAYKNRRFTERGAGELDRSLYSESGEVFGVSGALGFYRRNALEDVGLDIEKVKNSDPSQPPLGKGRRKEYFDEDFFFYQEDVDLAWRLRLRGWSAYYLPNVIAYHHRGVKGDDQQGNIATFKNRFKKPGYSQMVSYRNHLMMLVKNEQNFWRHSPYILWYELRKFVFIFFFEQKTLKGLWQFFKLLPKMRVKRKIIQDRAKVSAKQMRKWFK